MKNFPSQQGFVILFTILIATIIMVITLGMYSIATREGVLSGTAREAQYAFYAADAGVECVLYAQYLARTNPTGNPFDPTYAPFSCAKSPRSFSTKTNSTDPYVVSFMVDTVRNTCVRASVFDSTRTMVVNGVSTNVPIRRVIAQGYNICNPATSQPITSNPLLVERDLDVQYIPTGGSITP